MTVSSSSENVMLNTVRMLRRLLRNALLVTKRVMVISLPEGSPVDKDFARGTAGAIYVRSEDKASVGYRQLACFLLAHLSPAKPARHSQGVYCCGATTQTVSTR